MAASASSKPPEGGKPLLDGQGEEDEAEMTSIMDAEQRRELQRAAREAARVQAPVAAEAKPEELERATARPPAEHEAIAAGELTIPKAAPVPAEAEIEAPAPAKAPAATTPAASSSSPVWVLVAFALLLAAVAFALRS